MKPRTSWANETLTDLRVYALTLGCRFSECDSLLQGTGALPKGCASPEFRQKAFLCHILAHIWSLHIYLFISVLNYGSQCNNPPIWYALYQTDQRRGRMRENYKSRTPSLRRLHWWWDILFWGPRNLSSGMRTFSKIFQLHVLTWQTIAVHRSKTGLVVPDYHHSHL